MTPSAARPGMQLRRAEAVLLVAGPSLLVGGWLILIANAGRGANDGWYAGHALLFIANAAWLPIALLLRRISGGPAGSVDDPTLWLVVLGTVAIAGQLAIDLVAWALSLNQEELRAFFAAIRERAVLSLAVHTLGPSLLFLGLFISAVRVGRGQPAARFGAGLVAGGILVVAVGAVSTFSLVILGGYVAVLAGFAGIAIALRSTRARAQAPRPVT